MPQPDQTDDRQVKAAADTTLGDLKSKRFEVLVSEYGDARYKTVDAIYDGKEYRPEYERGLALYGEITDRVTKLRRLALDELARAGHPDTKRVSAADVLRLLDGAR